MIHSRAFRGPSRPPYAPPLRRPPASTGTLYGYAFLEDFVLLYPVYALLFRDTGLSVWQISSLFALWSVTGVLLEVPSGAWADSVSRRRLLWIGPLLTAAGFALWTFLPSYGAFALGFVLWGAGGALASGACEALVYDELERLGAADRYARVMGRARAAGLVAVMAATGLAGPVFAWGGHTAVGAASVLVCLLAAATAARLPEHRTPAAGQDSWTATLKAGLAEARADRSVRGALLLVPAVTAVWGALDEYTPLLVRDTGVSDALVPYLLLLIWAGATAGGLLAGAGERLGPKGLAALLAGAALALAVGAGAGDPGWNRPRGARLRRLPGGERAGRRPAPAAHRRLRPGHPHLGRRAGHGTGHRRRVRRLRGARHGHRTWHGLRVVRRAVPGDRAPAGC